jgi:hypothetical protein
MRAMPGPFVSFLTDFGTDATAPAVCRGVILGICPEARIVDLTHAVTRQDVAEGAFLLWSAVPHLPVGVHLAVVDPGVGTARRGVAVRAARGDLLVGPDNGLLRPAVERLGGLAAAHALTEPRLWKHPVSSTFHGRDVFAPVTAHLAHGEPLSAVGETLDPGELVDLQLPRATARDGGLDTGVIFVDTFGNCRLAGDLGELQAAVGAITDGDGFRVQTGSIQAEMPYHATFGQVAAGEAMLYEDADYAGLGLAINHGSAADSFGMAAGSAVRIERR